MKLPPTLLAALLVAGLVAGAMVQRVAVSAPAAA